MKESTNKTRVMKEEFIKEWYESGGGWTMQKVADWWLTKFDSVLSMLEAEVEGLKRNHLDLIAPDYEVSDNKKIRQLGRELKDAETAYNLALSDVLAIINNLKQ